MERDIANRHVIKFSRVDDILFRFNKESNIRFVSKTYETDFEKSSMKCIKRFITYLQKI